MMGEFDFNPQNVLNKALIFDTKKINEEIIMNKIIEALSDKKMMDFLLNIQLVQIILP